MCQLTGHRPLPGEESWEPWVGSQGPGRLCFLPRPCPRTGWAINALVAGGTDSHLEGAGRTAAQEMGQEGRMGRPTPSAVDAAK